MVEAPFVWGRGGARLTPDQIARLREQEAAQTGAVDTSPVGHWTQGAARVANALAGVIKSKRLDKAEAENATYNSGLLDQIFGGGEASKFPAAPSTGGAPATASAAPAGDMTSYRDAIASIESAGSGDYAAIGPTHPKLGRALGRYQVMEANIGPWSREVLGREVTPDEFMASPELQDQIFDGKFGSYVQQFGPEGAAQAWFGGPGGVGKTDRKDVLGTSIGGYGEKFTKALGGNAPAIAFAPTTQPTDALAAIEAQAPASGYVDPMVSAQPAAAAPLDAMAAQAQQMPQAAPTAAPAANGLDPMVLAEAIRARGGDPNRGIFPVIAGLPGERNLGQQTAQANPQQLLRAMADPQATDATKRIAQALYEQEMARMQAEQEYQRKINDPEYKLGLEKQQLEINALRNPQPKPTDDMREYELAVQQGYTGKFSDYMIEMKKAGATSINNNLGGGDNKQVFDAMAESAASARSAVTGLNSLREAKAAVEGGIISGAGADARLGLQKIGALLGVADPTVIENTETFRAAIAPQVAAMMKATVGSTQISNADREFAQQAAGGSITLDERSIRRLVDIMERAGQVAVESHMDRLNKVYPEGQGFDRERALFGVTLPEIAPVAPAPGGAEPSIDDLLKIYGK